MASQTRSISCEPTGALNTCNPIFPLYLRKPKKSYDERPAKTALQHSEQTLLSPGSHPITNTF
jgi:hypothetical protein